MPVRSEGRVRLLRESTPSSGCLCLCLCHCVCACFFLTDTDLFVLFFRMPTQTVSVEYTKLQINRAYCLCIVIMNPLKWSNSKGNYFKELLGRKKRLQPAGLVYRRVIALSLSLQSQSLHLLSYLPLPWAIEAKNSIIRLGQIRQYSTGVEPLTG